MADANADSAVSEDAVPTPEIETTSEQTAPETTPVEAPTPEAPKTFSHSPRLVGLAQQHGLHAHIVASMSPEELRSEIAELQLVAREKMIEELVRPKAAPKVEEDDFDLGEDLSEFDPKIVGVLKKVGKTASASEKRAQQAEAELKKLRDEKDVGDFQSQITPIFESLGIGKGAVQPGSSDHARRNAILHYLGTLQASGQHPGPPEVAIPMAAAVLGFSAGVTQTPATVKPGRPAPTPTARPTNRLGAHEDENSEDALIARWDRKLKADLEAANGTGGKDFIP